MTNATYATIVSLRAQADSAAAEAGNPIRSASDTIKAAIRAEVDPYILAGALVEGIAMTILRGIPEQKQDQVAADVLRLMCARLQSLGMLDT